MWSARGSTTSCIGVKDTYEYVVRSLWIASPAVGVRQAIALMSVWAHGCLGLYFWLRYRRWYPRAAPWLLIVAVLLPVLALLGFAHAGQTVAAMGAARRETLSTRPCSRRASPPRTSIDRAIYVGFVAIWRWSVLAPAAREPDRAAQSDRGATIPAGRPCAYRKATACSKPAGSAASRIIPFAAAAAAARPAASR